MSRSNKNSVKFPNGKSVIIDNIEIYLQEPDDIRPRWNGWEEESKLLIESWHKFNETDSFLNPVLFGFTEVGKSIVRAAVNESKVSIYLFNCLPDMRPETLQLSRKLVTIIK
jgi:hypothetical protein